MRRATAQVLLGAAVAMCGVGAQAAPELGVFRWNSPDGPKNTDAYSQWLGNAVVTPAAFEARTTWDQISGEAWNLQPWSQWVQAQPGRNISLAVPLQPSSGATLAGCAAGQYDAYWTKLANNLAYYRLHWAYLRLGWEMDGNWYAWGAPQGSGKEASFAGCFRRVVQVMRQAQPANQWKFVLNVAMSWTSKAYLDAVWPGDAYVDVIGWDYYDQSWASNTYPYPSNCDAACRLTRQQNAWNANATRLYILRDYAAAHGKKLAFPEWAVFTTTSYGNTGGDNPYFIQKMYDFINDPANNVAYHAYFDVTYTGFNGQLSGTTSFPQSAALFKKLFSQPSTSTSTGTSTNTAPTVSVSSPTAGQTVSGTIAYAANASDNAGVARVEFSLDSAALLSDSSAPYGGSLDTTKLVNGTHVLKAVAYDAQGLSASSQVSINVQNSTATSGTATGYAGTPYSGTPIALPVAFPAVNFDKGGEGVAYHDLSTGNLGGQYRTSESVDIYASTDSAGGPFQVANFQTGEWMSYTVNVPANGNYDLSIHASNNLSPGAFHIEVDGVNVSGTVSVPLTGSWSTYQWIGKKGVPLTAGKHVLKLVSEQQWFNVSAISVLASVGTTTGGTSGSPTYAGTPYSGTPVALPAAFPAANFDKGGEGVAYHDLSSGNLGGQYRTSDGVDIYTSTDTASGPYQVQNFQTGEWMSYTVNVPANGSYELGIRASNNLSPGAFHIEVDGVNVTGSIAVPLTGSWATYQWFGKQGVPLTAGKHVVKLVSEQQWFNVTAIRVQ